MEEKEREREDGDEEESAPKETPLIELDVTIHNNYKGKILVPKGASLKEALEIISKQFNVNVSEYQVILDAQTIDLKSENPILTSNSTLALIKKIVGGKNIPLS